MPRQRGASKGGSPRGPGGRQMAGWDTFYGGGPYGQPQQSQGRNFNTTQRDVPHIMPYGAGSVPQPPMGMSMGSYGSYSPGAPMGMRSFGGDYSQQGGIGQQGITPTPPGYSGGGGGGFWNPDTAPPHVKDRLPPGTQFGGGPSGGYPGAPNYGDDPYDPNRPVDIRRNQ